MSDDTIHIKPGMVVRLDNGGKVRVGQKDERGLWQLHSIYRNKTAKKPFFITEEKLIEAIEVGLTLGVAQHIDNTKTINRFASSDLNPNPDDDPADWKKY